MMRNKLIAIVLGLVFFLFGVFTLPHYGINWDTINHLPRGQVYLNYFLTGKKDFSNLPDYFKEWQATGQWYWQKGGTLSFNPDVEKSSIPRVSMYQSAGVDFKYFMLRDGGHPPLSDILESVFNLILFQKFGLINDVDSYRIYGVLLAAALVGLIYYWMAEEYGSFPGLISALSLSLFPFFWSESHFNTEKDTPETVYWSFFLFAIWNAVKKKSWKWLLGSGIFFGLALGTKFNILFVGFVVLPWLIVYARKLFKPKFIAAAFFAVLLGLTIFVGSWPFLWPDIYVRVQKVTGFYSSIGLTAGPSTDLIGPFNTNAYALLWILYATPLVILILSSLGIIDSAKKITKDKNGLRLLALLWFVVPVARVTWPGTTIYGGIRQIMEFIPAVALLAGFGSLAVRDFVVKRWRLLSGVLIIAAFIPITIKIISIHPNENVYFNPLMGGLSGARAKNFPFWGNSFGAAYRQAADWLNDNAEKDAKVVYAYELIPNIPRIWLRTDFDLHNSLRSGYLRQGEYAITLPYQGTERRSYFDMYLRKFLNPVYEAKVDGVPVVSVWKNDDAHLKQPWVEAVDYKAVMQRSPGKLTFDLGSILKISRLDINYGEYLCSDLSSARVQVSVDGVTWSDLPGNLPQDWLIPVLGQQPKDGKFTEPFVGQETRYVNILLSPDDACMKKNLRNFKIRYLE